MQRSKRWDWLGTTARGPILGLKNRVDVEQADLSAVVVESAVKGAVSSGLNVTDDGVFFTHQSQLTSFHSLIFCTTETRTPL